MKIKSLLIGMLACSAMVACTNEDEPEVNTGNENGGKAEAYMSVKLVMTETGGSRATDGGYNPGEDGEAEGTISEQKIDGTKSIFLFYDELGNWVTSGQLINADAFTNGVTGTHTGHTGDVDINDIFDDAYVVLSSPTDDIKKIKQVLTVVNYSKTGSLLQKTKTQALATIATDAAGEDPANAGFLMSTSVYLDAAGNLVNTTAVLGEDVKNADGTVTKANIQATQADAKANPVEIYIERASAKVQLTHGTSKTPIVAVTQFEVQGSEDATGDEAGGQEGNDIVIDGVQYPAYISIDGWTINNVNTTTNLVKQLETTWTDWSNASDFRSYWAKGTKYANTDNTGLTVYSWNNAVANMAGDNKLIVNDAMYCYEQTVANPAADKGTASPNITTMLIAASIKTKASATATEATAVGNIYQYGGVFYGETDYMNLLLKQIKDAGYVKAGETDGSYADLVATDLTIATDGTLAGILVTVASTGTYYKDVVETKDETTGAITYSAKPSSAVAINTYLNGAAATETAAAIEGLAYVTEAQGFAGGKCYYQIPIEHLEDSYGVVRNHWYKLNISKVIRIGNAVYNPTVLIPQIPEQETSYYLAAEIHVLNWHVVEQDVTLD